MSIANFLETPCSFITATTATGSVAEIKKPKSSATVHSKLEEPVYLKT